MCLILKPRDSEEKQHKKLLIPIIGLEKAIIAPSQRSAVTYARPYVYYNSTLILEFANHLVYNETQACQLEIPESNVYSITRNLYFHWS